MRRWWRMMTTPLRAARRRLDVELMWPMLREQCGGNVHVARFAFRGHCLSDGAWVPDLTEAQIAAYVEELT